MSTTAIFAELLVCGLQTLTWLVLLAVAIVGPEPLAPLLEVPSLASVFVVGFSYALGVIFDRLWDQVLKWTGIGGWLSKQARAAAAGGKPGSEFDALRRRVYGTDAGNAARFVDYNRSRMRIARASTFNFLLITLAGTACCAVHAGRWGTQPLLMVAVGGSLLFLVSALALHDLRTSYYRVLKMVAPEGEGEGDDGES
jgi:hypothetical protein